MDIRLKHTHFNRHDICFLYKPTYKLFKSIKHSLNEDYSFVPRFTLKDTDLFDDFPVNTPVKPDVKLIMKAIQYGMILNIDYKGEEDGRLQGHNRTIYPMAIGLNKNGKYLIRGYHLKGWSVSGGPNVEKEWRLFRFDRLLNIEFVGAFYRLAPDGYNHSGDKSMTKLIKNANFDEIRKNQEILIKRKEIDLQDRVVVTKNKKIYVTDLHSKLYTTKPNLGGVIDNKDMNKVNISFAEKIGGETQNQIAIIGSNINKGMIIKLFVDKRDFGSYRITDNMLAKDVGDIVNQHVEFKAYLFDEAK